MTALAVLAVVAVVLAALWVYSTAHRLDRLHVRSDTAWLALELSLGRRAAVVRAVVAAEPGAAPAGLVALADRAERSARPGREAAENTLSAALRALTPAALGPSLAAELADAEARVQLARRFHNDAVRDTRALRSRRPVRLLRLGGTAAMPGFFELVEPATDPVPLPAPRVRPSSRVLLLDEHDRVLLLRGTDRAATTSWWFTTGGGQEAGETLVAAGVREVAEETGLVLVEPALRGPLWTRSAVFDFDGETIEARETFFVARTAGFTPSRAGFTELERATLVEARWCTPEDVRALELAGERVFPERLDALLGEAVAAADGHPVGVPRVLP